MRTIRRQPKATSLDHAIELAKRYAKERRLPSKVMADLMGVELKTYYRWLLDNTLPLNRITELGRAAAVFADELVFGLLKKGNTTLCYDGQNFFDTDHPVFEKVDGTGNKTLVKNLFTATGGTQGTPWYLLDTSRAIKPMIFQQRKPMKLSAMTKDDDEGVFMRNEYRYGVDGRCNAGFGFWQMASMSTEELTPDNFAKVFNAMASQKGDGGRPLDIRPTVLLVPSTMEDLANSIVKPDKYENGKFNPHHNKVKVVASPWLL